MVVKVIQELKLFAKCYLICIVIIFLGWWRVISLLAPSPERLFEAIAFGLLYIAGLSSTFALGAAVLAYFIVKVVQHSRSEKGT